ncbi:MAG: VPLPA-CTERM sorting domain-containing protein [Tropicimonas sp.]|uniref:VPLPA-CTERM sorting domain-containing protein n=1 Tax=Tropicimonas sp. TaxID=2067044 RepID=UPI003A85F697
MKRSLAGLLAGALLFSAGPSTAATLVSTWKAVTTHNDSNVMTSVTFRFANDVVDAAYFTAADLVDVTLDGFEGIGAQSQINSYGNFTEAHLAGTEFMLLPPNHAGVPNHIGTDGSMGQGWKFGYYLPDGNGGYQTVLSGTRDAYAAPRFSVRAYWSGDPRYCTECSLRLYKGDAEYDGQASSFDAGNATAVPLPATLPLMLGALVGGWGIARRKRAN